MKAILSFKTVIILTLLLVGITTPTLGQTSLQEELSTAAETIGIPHAHGLPQQPPPGDPAAKSAPLLQEPAATPTPPPDPERTETALTPLGAAPVVKKEALAPGEEPTEIDNSTVNSVSPDLLPPAIPFDLCFNVTVDSPDLEYMDRFDVDLPDGWTVNSVAATPSTTGEITEEGVEAGNVVYWQDDECPPPTYYGAWWNGTYDFCANVTVPDCVGEPWSFPWNIIGDGWGSAPHSVSGTAGPVQCLSPGIYLFPATLEIQGCNGLTQIHVFDVLNNTASDGTFDLSYALANPVYGTLTGPASLTISNSMTASLGITLTPALCLPNGLDLVATVEASGNGYTDTVVITKTIVTGGLWQQIPNEPDNGRMDTVVASYDGLVWSINGYGSNANVRYYDPVADTWTTVAGSAPSFGVSYARSGCQVTDTVYVYGDTTTPGFTGLWSYSMDTNTWASLSPGGSPPPTDIWAPAWAYDPEDNLCYMTGGADTPGPGNLNTVYTYDPAADEWGNPTLPNFTTARDFHAAWIVGSGTDKMLCVAGGADSGSSELDSTQCYDFDAGAWNAEDADLGALPANVGGLGYAKELHGGTDERLWIVGGIEDGSISDHAVYYDVNLGSWQDGGNLASGAVFRDSATVLDGQAYKLGGSTGGFSYTGRADRHAECPVCDRKGWLEGYVHDYDGTSATCSDAAVHVVPEGLDVAVDASGYYTIPLVPFEYEVSASAAGYPQPDGPYTVTVSEGAVTSRDFRLVRPDIAVAPTSLSVSAVATSTVTRTLTITNSSAYMLEYEIREIPPPMGPSAVAQPSGQPGIEVEPELQATMAADDTTGYLIYFRERPDLSPASGMDWIERGRFVAKALQETAERSQARVRAHLDRHGVDYKAFWIDNVIAVESSSRATFNGLLAFPEIGALRARRHPQLIEPVGRGTAGFSVMAVEDNIAHVGADQVWGLGFRGEGLVVANIDTGVRYTHNALVGRYRGNQGGGSFSHDHNWLGAAGGSSTPVDDYGHGSHTMGIMIGDDGGANQIGMAPGAQWIACDGCEGLSCPDAALLTCAQWVAAPYPIGDPGSPNPDLRPHVVNNSWGDCGTSYDDWYQDVVDDWHAMGIYPLFANGNASNCGYDTPPGCNTVGNPARYGNVTGVGSTGQSNGQYATHSNWGPTDDPDTVNPRGYPDLKPQVLAPGVGIRSSFNGSDSQYYSWGGTSMSTPHVSGLIALMWQAAPCLVGDYATTETLIEQTATPIPYASGCGGEGPGDVPNHATGWGEIYAPAAVQAAMDYCNTNWLSWVATDPVTGTLASGSQVVEVSFTCDGTESQKPQPLQGTLLIQHNDPCEDNVGIALEFFCVSLNPVPMWDKEVWVNGDAQTPVEGPHTVRPSDTVVIADYVGAAFSQIVTSVLTETWGDALGLVAYDVGGVGTVTTDSHTLVWNLSDVPPNTFYPITKTLEVQYGNWVTDAVTESYVVQGALTQPDDVVVAFERSVPAIKVDKSGPTSARSGDTIQLTLVISSDGSFGGTAVLTDALPVGMTYAGNLTATAGLAWENGNVIHWTYTNTLMTLLEQGFEGGAVPPPGWTVQAQNITHTWQASTFYAHEGTYGALVPWDYAQDEWLLSPVITPTGGELSLWSEGSVYWCRDDSDNCDLNAWMVVDVIGGGDDVLIAQLEDDWPGSWVWTEHSFDLTPLLPGGPVRIGFEYVGDDGADVGVDDILLQKLLNPPMPAGVTITFDMQTSDVGKTCNVAKLDWGEGYTDDEHCIEVSIYFYLPVVMRDS
jgi:subtilisin family serine protease